MSSPRKTASPCIRCNDSGRTVSGAWCECPIGLLEHELFDYETPLPTVEELAAESAKQHAAGKVT
jgi:hypothetical protein